MFSLIAIVCHGFVCVSLTPPKVYTTDSACMEDAIVLYQVIQSNPNKEIIDMECYEWHVKA